jgi:translation elongation factor P/translation initiation factor 5A
MMKKCLLLCSLFCLGLNVIAGDVLDATKISKITFSGDQVTVVYNDGTETLVADMATVTIDFSNATSVEERLAAVKQAGLEGLAVYNLNGQLVGKSVANLPKGVYIIGKKKVIIK